MKNKLEILSNYENNFYTAIHSDYSRALWRNDFEVMLPIYEEWTGKQEYLNQNCSKCKLSFLKRLGKLYFKNKEEYARQQERNSNKKNKKQSED